MIRDHIKAANDRPLVKVSIPEWGCDVHIRAMSGSQRDLFEQFWAKKDGSDEIRARLAAMVLCEEDGTPVYESVAEGVVELKDKSAAALDRIFDTVLEQNAMRAGDLEEVAKNS